MHKKLKPGLVILYDYDMWPGSGSGLILQLWGPARGSYDDNTCQSTPMNFSSLLTDYEYTH